MPGPSDCKRRTLRSPKRAPASRAVPASSSSADRTAFQLPFRADDLQELWEKKLREPPEKLLAWVESESVKRQLLRWAWSFFSQERNDYQIDFDVTLKNDAVKYGFDMFHRVPWINLRETLVNLAIALDIKSPKGRTRLVLHDHPQSTVARTESTFRDIWAAASCNLVATLDAALLNDDNAAAVLPHDDIRHVHSPRNQHHTPPAADNHGHRLLRARHSAALELLKALHDDLRDRQPQGTTTATKPQVHYFRNQLGIAETFRQRQSDCWHLFAFDCRSLVALWCEKFAHRPRRRAASTTATPISDDDDDETCGWGDGGDHAECLRLRLLEWIASPAVRGILGEWRAAFSPVTTTALVEGFKMQLGVHDGDGNFDHSCDDENNGPVSVGESRNWADAAAYAAWKERHGAGGAGGDLSNSLRAELAALFEKVFWARGPHGWADITDEELGPTPAWARPWIKAVGQLCVQTIASGEGPPVPGSSSSADDDDNDVDDNVLEKCAELCLELLMAVYRDIEANPHDGHWAERLENNVYPFDETRLMWVWERLLDLHPHNLMMWIESRNVKEHLLSWCEAFYAPNRGDFQDELWNDITSRTRFLKERDIEDVPAWEFARNDIAGLLIELEEGEDIITLYNTSVQTLIDGGEITWIHCWMVATIKLVGDGAMAVFDGMTPEAMPFFGKNLRNSYLAALELLWSAHHDLIRQGPHQGQPGASQPSYFRRLLALGPEIPLDLSLHHVQEASQEVKETPQTVEDASQEPQYTFQGRSSTGTCQEGCHLDDSQQGLSQQEQSQQREGQQEERHQSNVTMNTWYEESQDSSVCANAQHDHRKSPDATAKPQHDDSQGYNLPVDIQQDNSQRLNVSESTQDASNQASRIRPSAAQTITHDSRRSLSQVRAWDLTPWGTELDGVDFPRVAGITPLVMTLPILSPSPRRNINAISQSPHNEGEARILGHEALLKRSRPVAGENGESDGSAAATSPKRRRMDTARVEIPNSFQMSDLIREDAREFTPLTQHEQEPEPEQQPHSGQEGDPIILDEDDLLLGPNELARSDHAVSQASQDFALSSDFLGALLFSSP